MQFLSQMDLKDKRVLVRCGFNVPMKNGNIKDDSRIVAAIPTIKYCLQHARQVIMCSHLGRPKNSEPEFSLKPVAKHLQSVLNLPVSFAETFQINPNDKLVLLENIRFQPGEEKNDPALAKQLASLADVFVLDAFADMHRKHASTYGIAKLLPSCAGLLVQREVTMLERILDPVHPFVAVVGFAKIKDKLEVLEKLLEKVDRICIGGAVVFTFYKAANIEIGNSLVEPDMIPTVTKLLRKYGKKIQLPTDIVVGTSVEDKQPQVVPYNKIPADKMGLDIGPVSVEAFGNSLAHAKTVFWNGPVGVFEHPPYDAATIALAQKIVSLNVVSIVGGGDTVAAVEHAKVASGFSHVSTGGGATLDFLSGVELPGLAVLGYYSTRLR